MKKQYEKPTIEIELFSMDIDVMYNWTQDELEDLKEIYPGTPGDDVEFNEWLASIGFGDGNNGFCYFTIKQLS